ncbi:MAG: histidinol dehydrogenase [Chloroflexota bacterium]
MASLRIVRSRDLTEADSRTLYERRAPLDDIIPVVNEIMAAVRDEGDSALRRYTSRFDGADLDDLAVSPGEFAAAHAILDDTVKRALESQMRAVQAFHVKHLSGPGTVETAPGVVAWREWRPIERVGLYVPGGRGAYPSSVVMLGVPATIAGCPEIVLCTPPDADGSIPAATLVAAEMVGIHRVFKLGGAQAIAAMTYGTDSVPRVDKLFGAGNAYVTAAKLLAFPLCALDAPAGPSELLIVADDTAPPAWIAADLLSDVEHGPDSPAVLLTPSAALGDAVAEEVERQLETLPRQDIARQALERCSMIVITESMAEAIDMANQYAPEHLQLMANRPHELLADIRHVGSAFLGSYAPNAAGDYATGTNHVLPTARYARVFAPVSVESFGRMIQCQELTSEGLKSLLPTVGALARAEGLEGHARAVEARFTEPS